MKKLKFRIIETILDEPTGFILGVSTILVLASIVEFIVDAVCKILLIFN